MKKILCIYLITFLVIILMVIAPVLAYKIYYMFTKDKVLEFSIETWDDNVSDRKYMIDDLVKDYGLVGMTKDEIAKLLGSSYMSGETSYFVGDGGVGPLIMFINYDEDDIVTGYT